MHSHHTRPNHTSSTTTTSTGKRSRLKPHLFLLFSPVSSALCVGLSLGHQRVPLLFLPRISNICKHLWPRLQQSIGLATTTIRYWGWFHSFLFSFLQHRSTITSSSSKKKAISNRRAIRIAGSESPNSNQTPFSHSEIEDTLIIASHIKIQEHTTRRQRHDTCSSSAAKPGRKHMQTIVCFGVVSFWSGDRCSTLCSPQTVACFLNHTSHPKGDTHIAHTDTHTPRLTHLSQAVFPFPIFAHSTLLVVPLCFSFSSFFSPRILTTALVLRTNYPHPSLQTDTVSRVERPTLTSSLC